MEQYEIYYSECGSYKARGFVVVEAATKEEAIEKVRSMSSSELALEYDYEMIDCEAY